MARSVNKESVDKESTAAKDWSTLLLSLREADQLSRQLLDVLECERSALEQRNYPQFETLLSDKAQLLAALEHNTQQRSDWLRQQGFETDGDALKRVQIEAPALASIWRKLATLWEQCQHASRVNEQISQRTRHVVGKLLDILSGNAGQGSIYDGKGATTRTQSGRPITSA